MVGIPAFLSSKNFGALEVKRDSIIRIATNFSTQQWLVNQKNFQKLQKIIKVKFLLIEDIFCPDSSHQTMSNAYMLAIKDQLNEFPQQKNYFIFLTPDSVWNNGSFLYLIKLARQGFEAVFLAGLRVNKQSSWGSWQKEAGKAEGDRFLAENMLKISFRHLHKMTSELNFLGRHFLNEWPSHLYFINKTENTLIAKCFHLHPVMAKVERNILLKNDTIDGNYINRLKIPKKKQFVITNSTSCLGVDLTCENRTWGVPCGTPNLNKIEKFMLNHTNASHREFFGKKIFFSLAPITKKNGEIESLIDRIDKRLKKHYTFSGIVHRHCCFLAGRALSALKIPQRLIKSIIKRIKNIKRVENGELIIKSKISKKLIKKILLEKRFRIENKRKAV